MMFTAYDMSGESRYRNLWETQYKLTPLLILANKSDLKDAVPATEIHLNLGLDLIRNRNWHIISTCALTGSGLVEGIDWLANNIKQLLAPTV
uniref:ADP-ribosylation factor-like protein 6 n=1 Tax=Globodera pallida TaxID=36090 RepID=A0A183C6E6_GLOPA